jgi:hypothetical protein
MTSGATLLNSQSSAGRPVKQRKRIGFVEAVIVRRPRSTMHYLISVQFDPGFRSRHISETRVASLVAVEIVKLDCIVRMDYYPDNLDQT